MAAVNISSDFGAPKIKSVSVSSSICHEVMGPDAMIFVFWMLSFKLTFSLSSFTGLGNFEHYFTSVWDECNCAVVWAFFGIAFLWVWNKNWPFPVPWPYQTTWPDSWVTYIQVRKQQLELDTEQQTGYKWEREYVKAVYSHPAYLTYMQSPSWEMLGWMSTSWNQDCQEK